MYVKDVFFGGLYCSGSFCVSGAFAEPASVDFTTQAHIRELRRGNSYRNARKVSYRGPKY